MTRPIYLEGPTGKKNYAWTPNRGLRRITKDKKWQNVHAVPECLRKIVASLEKGYRPKKRSNSGKKSSNAGKKKKSSNAGKKKSSNAGKKKKKSQSGKKRKLPPALKRWNALVKKHVKPNKHGFRKIPKKGTVAYRKLKALYMKSSPKKTSNSGKKKTSKTKKSKSGKKHKVPPALKRWNALVKRHGFRKSPKKGTAAYRKLIALYRKASPKKRKSPKKHSSGKSNRDTFGFGTKPRMSPSKFKRNTMRMGSKRTWIVKIRNGVKVWLIASRSDIRKAQK